MIKDGVVFCEGCGGSISPRSGSLIGGQVLCGECAAYMRGALKSEALPVPHRELPVDLGRRFLFIWDWFLAYLLFLLSIFLPVAVIAMAVTAIVRGL